MCASALGVGIMRIPGGIARVTIAHLELTNQLSTGFSEIVCQLYWNSLRNLTSETITAGVENVDLST